MHDASTAAAVGKLPQPRPILRPLVLPTEHGGWGFLFEPLVLGLAVAPTAAGLLIALAALFGFLARQPLKLAMQDAVRGRTYPRTAWCRGFAAAYLAGAAGAMSAAVYAGGWRIALPFALVAPLACITLVADARNVSRAAIAEYAGAIAMSSTAASIALAAGWPFPVAFAPMALIALRATPAIAYVRTLVKRSHKQSAASWPAVAAHAIAAALAYAVAGWVAAAAMLALLARAAWGLAHEPPPAKRLGWREIAWGTVSVVVFAIALR